MKIKLDENMPAEIAAELREAGHDAETVPEEGLGGTADTPLLERAASESRIFVTLDKGIADVRKHPPNRFAGLILLRPGSTGREAVAAFARQHLPMLLQEELTGRLVIVTKTGIRFR